MLTKSNLRNKDLFGLCILGHSSLWEAKARTWRQEVKQRTQKNTAYLIPSHDLLGLLSCITQDYLPRGGTIHSELGLPTFIINQENALQICL